ncbi:hypothetical protein THZG08_350020 [Vibrio owensii]|nr:hypothetical protein THZG08_350020 [Vibrio owensii]CAH1572754.1 hypothetical protein THOA03_350019 [Vibrio owensii]
MYIHNYPQTKNCFKALFCPAFEQLMNNYFTELYTGSTNKLDRKRCLFSIENKKAEIT